MRKVKLNIQEIEKVFKEAPTDIKAVRSLFALVGINTLDKNIKSIDPKRIKINPTTNEFIFKQFRKKFIQNRSEDKPGFSQASQWLWFNKGWSSLANTPAEAKLKDFEVLIYKDAVTQTTPDLRKKSCG